MAEEQEIAETDVAELSSKELRAVASELPLEEQARLARRRQILKDQNANANVRAGAAYRDVLSGMSDSELEAEVRRTRKAVAEDKKRREGEE